MVETMAAQSVDCLVRSTVGKMVEAMVATKVVE